MAGNERFEDSIGRWLEEAAPNRLPGRVLDATFERTRQTRQESAWRHLPGRLQMPRFVPALGGAAILVLAAVLALNVARLADIGGQPTTVPTMSPLLATPTTAPASSPAPGSARFDSSIHGISIDLPSGWQARPATESWDSDSFTFDVPGVDVIFDPRFQDGLYITLASRPLGAQSGEDWCCAAVWAAADVCEGGGNFGRFTVDGAEATVVGCDGDRNRFQHHVVQAATATRGYVIYLHVADDPILQVAYTEAWFDAVLKTVDLAP